MVRILKKWFKGFVTHPLAIIKGNWFRIRKENLILYNNRYKICLSCKYKENSPIGETCGLCGCPLKSKLRVKSEKCELLKWEY